MIDQNNSVLKALLLALEAAPNDSSLLSHIADLFEKAQQFEKALAHYQRVLALNPLDNDGILGAYRCSKALNNATLSSAYQQLIDTLQLNNQENLPQIDGGENVDDTSKTTPINPATQNEQPARVRETVLRLVKDGDDIETWLDVEDSNIYLDDVGGMDDVKKRLELSFLGPLKNPELMKAYGKSVSGGLLLYGPPGCGKTFIARALAGELGAKFISVGLTDILDMYIGESERKLHEIFEAARRNAPAVLFFDELDALGQKRSQLRNTGMRSLVNQLLAEMDSMQGQNDNLFILGATNHPWDIDSALRRPGRFDRIVAVFPPDNPARQSILNYHLSFKPTDNVDVASLAKASAAFSGADLKYLCDCAAEYAIEEALETGKVRPLDTSDFNKPLKEIKPSTKSWFETAKNFAMFANESGAYDDLLSYIRKHNL